MSFQSQTLILRIELLETWHVGTGRGAGQHLDAVVDLDADGLPFVPGRMLRGLLRDAAECLEAWNHVPAGSVDAVFGGLAEHPQAPGRQLSRSGRLAVSPARLPPALREQLMSEPAAVRAALRMPSFQTAIDPRTGGALEQTLRGIELAVPMMLESTLEIRGTSAAEIESGWALLEAALPLVRAVGAHRARGHGRARLGFTSAAAGVAA